LIDSFDAFKKNVVPHFHNVVVNALAIISSSFPSEDFDDNRFVVEFIYRPSFPENVTLIGRCLKEMNRSLNFSPIERI
jgi:hypothetical protein